MKHLLLCFSLFVFAQPSFAAFPKFSVDDSSQTAFINQQQFLLNEFCSMTAKEYKEQTGRKRSFKERLTFKLLQHYLKKEQNKTHKTNIGVAIGGFLLGLFVPAIGVAIAYIFSKNKTLRTWAWVGFGVFLLLLFFVLIVVLLSGALFKLTFSSII